MNPRRYRGWEELASLEEQDQDLEPVARQTLENEPDEEDDIDLDLRDYHGKSEVVISRCVYQRGILGLDE